MNAAIQNNAENGYLSVCQAYRSLSLQSVRWVDAQQYPPLGQGDLLIHLPLGEREPKIDHLSGSCVVTAKAVNLLFASEGDGTLVPLIITYRENRFGRVGQETLNFRPFDTHDYFVEQIRKYLLQALRMENNEQASCIDSLASLLVYHLLSHAPVQSSHSEKVGLTPYQLQRIQRYIDDHPEEMPTVVELAEFAKLSVFHFTRVFKRTIGLTPYQYIVHTKLQEAQRLLRDTDLSIVQVGLAIGYQQASSFSYSFNKRYGYSPTYYRRHCDRLPDLECA